EEGSSIPLPDICVNVSDYDTSFFFFGGWTDASGAYTVGGLPPGDYKVQFEDCSYPAMYVGEWYNDQPDFESADLVPVTAGVNTSGIDAALALGGSISGTVTEEGTGTPLPDMCVWAYDYDMPPDLWIYPAGWGSTDASGAYTVGGLAAGDYKVQFNDCSYPAMYVGEWYNDQLDFESADLVSVTAGVNTSGIDAALALGGSISGTVTEEGTGTPLPDMCVWAYDYDMPPDLWIYPAGWGSTDASGAYTV
ncbi:unnamed protein product, partial [marine sediment metagenome]